MSLIFENNLDGRTDAAQARAQVQEGYSLPGYYYLSSERFREDLEQMRAQTWFIAGHESQIPNTGDYCLYQFGKDSIILMRDTSGAVNGFYNSCRHRGAQLCQENQGNVKALVCPYHAWTFKLDGSLMRPRSMPDSFDPKDWGLKRCAVRTMEGIIFVCLAKGQVPDFEDFAQRLRPFVAQYGIHGAKVAAEKSFIGGTNWKLPVENFQENYHVPSVHKDLNRVLVTTPPAVEPIDKNGETYSDRMKRLGRYLEPFMDDVDSPHLQMAAQMEIGHGHLSATLDGKPVAPLMGKFTEWTGGWTVINFNPFSHAILFDDFVQLITYTPIDLFKTEGRMIWLVRPDAVEGVDYDPKQFTEFFTTVMQEDTDILNINHAGLVSSAYSPCQLSLEEDLVSRFHQWYFKNIVDKRD